MLLQPPKRFLKEIEFSGSGEWFKLTLPSLFASDLYACLFRCICTLLEEFFRKELAGSLELNKQIVLDALVEPLMNAVEHGNKKEPAKEVIIGCWLGKGGIIFGFQDEGDFYRSQEVKIKVRKRRFVSSSRPDRLKYGAMIVVCDEVDRIFVDTKQNTLFILLYKDSLLKQKNEELPR